MSRPPLSREVRNLVSEQNVERAQPPEPVRRCASEIRRVPTVCVECVVTAALGGGGRDAFDHPYVRVTIGIRPIARRTGMAESSGLIQSIDALGMLPLEIVGAIGKHPECCGTITFP